MKSHITVLPPPTALPRQDVTASVTTCKLFCFSQLRPQGSEWWGCRRKNILKQKIQALLLIFFFKKNQLRQVTPQLFLSHYFSYFKISSSTLGTTKDRTNAENLCFDQWSWISKTTVAVAVANVCGIFFYKFPQLGYFGKLLIFPAFDYCCYIDVIVEGNMFSAELVISKLSCPCLECY